MNFILKDIQDALNETNLQGWLFTDLHGQDALAYRILGLSEDILATRRWFYWIPSNGKPCSLVHSVEASILDSLPGEKLVYAGWKAMHEALQRILSGQSQVAMQYSPLACIPSLSLVDGGTIDLVRSFNVKPVSSANLVTRFESRIDSDGFKSHRRAGKIVQHIKDQAFEMIGKALCKGTTLSEFELQQWIVNEFTKAGLVTDHAPVVAIDDHAANPHYSPCDNKKNRIFAPNQAVLIDLWARKDTKSGIYYDITWCAWTGKKPSKEYSELFELACKARDTALDLVKTRFQEGHEIQGWEVDAKARSIITAAGHGEHFVHRTGHNIGRDVHGAGVNMDDFESHDERRIPKNCCFSIEPGIYIPDGYGVRTEIDVCILENGAVEVFGPIQNKLILIPVSE